MVHREKERGNMDTHAVIYKTDNGALTANIYTQEISASRDVLKKALLG